MLINKIMRENTFYDFVELLGYNNMALTATHTMCTAAIREMYLYTMVRNLK